MYICRYVYVYTVYVHLYIYICTYIQKTETVNFRLFVANGNGKQKFVFLGRQTINSNRRLLFQQTCLSIVQTY